MRYEQINSLSCCPQMYLLVKFYVSMLPSPQQDLGDSVIVSHGPKLPTTVCNFRLLKIVYTINIQGEVNYLLVTSKYLNSFH